MKIPAHIDGIAARLRQQFEFLLEVDKLKQIMRRTPLLDQSRAENDAEHSWHLAMFALVLSDHAGPNVNISRVIRMVLIHDIVEIDAGDTFLYDTSAEAQKKDENEQRAADRLFDLLPDDQRDEFRALWVEFEARQSTDAKFAAALDRLQPMLHNYFTQGSAWREHGVTDDKVRAANKPRICETAPDLWQLAEALIDDAVNQGYLPTRD